jgi:hypothetical protein
MAVSLNNLLRPRLAYPAITPVVNASLIDKLADKNRILQNRFDLSKLKRFAQRSLTDFGE